MIRVYPMKPCPAPRQHASDAWKPRPQVLRYRAFRDECRIRHVQLPQPYYHVLFVIAMPMSWSASKRLALHGMPHLQTPDKDNLEKALLDSVYGNDKHVWDGRVTKVWGNTDLIVVSALDLGVHPPMDLSIYYEHAGRDIIDARPW